jgi:hypothetical protein
MNQARKHRREFLERHLPEVLERPILEIGAADNPTFWPDEGPIRYLDVYSREELLHQYRSNPRRNPDHLVPVDYVTRSGLPDEVVTDRFSLIIANHVIEHLPDLLGWLASIRRIVAADGHLFLAIPDKRYTFDYIRRTTDVIDIVQGHAQATELSSYAQLRSVYYYRPVRADVAWGGGADAAATRRRFSLREAAARVREQVELASDTHWHVFTYESFVELWEELQAANLVEWRLMQSSGVYGGGDEFHVLLATAPRQPLRFPLWDPLPDLASPSS